MTKMKTLQFPTDPQFKQILRSDKEWYILTDLNLNILSAMEGGKDHIPTKTKLAVYTKIKRMVHGDRSIPVFELHSHPTQYKHHQNPSTPSVGDMRGNILMHQSREASLKWKVDIKGYGVVTKDGISIVILPDNAANLKQLKTFPSRYQNQVRELVKKDANRKTYPAAIKVIRERTGVDTPEKKGRYTAENFVYSTQIHQKAFDMLIKKEPHMKVITIRRTT